MSKHLVDIDNDLLEEATSILGASTMKEAVAAMRTAWGRWQDSTWMMRP